MGEFNPSARGARGGGPRTPPPGSVDFALALFRNRTGRGAADQSHKLSRQLSDKNRRHRNKGGRKFRASLRKFGKSNGLASPFIANTFGIFCAKPVNFAHIWSILFLSVFFWTYTPVYYTPVCSVPTSAMNLAVLRQRWQTLADVGRRRLVQSCQASIGS